MKHGLYSPQHHQHPLSSCMNGVVMNDKASQENIEVTPLRT